ncbi:MAG: pentapeptide repeat-containing protein [Candidatus Nitronauta litoralis]|uniref:Pentapeptide repeat-containing protein n=1 Tax=Candidatus Nitronauta litoralis TaxID=2705533 RepID=A0A7T0BTP7_9BACT|nr:MAG: pentapeptide repeat-containing protein [Candidatus Nitronauta litoralis]
MSDIRPFDENEWNRFKEERQAYMAAGGTGSGLPKPSITTMDLTGKFSKGEDWSFSIFEGCDLTGADLELANLQHCHFKGANLSGSNLKEADLTGTVLTQATLAGSDCSQVSLSKATLMATDASECKFDSADLESTTLFNADFSNSSFVDADLSKAQAEGANFTQTDLTRADLGSAGMPSTDFTDANLERANLSGTNLKNAQLTQANFFEADLIKTDMTGAVTLGMNIGGANLTNAKLPDEVEDFSGLKIIEESSKLLRTLFLMMVSVVAFSLLTIASTTDVQLLTNSTSFPLPIIGTPVSIQQFYLIAPFGIAGLFLYFHLYLMKHYRLIAKLPAVFPDGTPFDERLFPWMFNTWVKVFYRKLRSQDKVADTLTYGIVVFLGWMLVPTLLLIFMGRYAVNQNSTLSQYQFWLTLSTLTLAYYQLVILEEKIFRVRLGLQSKAFRLLWGFVVFVSSAYLIVIPEYNGKLINPSLSHSLFTADFSRQDVSSRPDNWDPQHPLVGVKGANLEGTTLKGAFGTGAFLAKANLENADLSESDFSDSDFRAANLKNARMVSGNFSLSNFDGATLEKAEMTLMTCFYCSWKNVILMNADLTGVRLNDAILDGTDIWHANLQDLDLTAASLVGVDFQSSNMQGTRLKNADVKFAYFANVKGLNPEQVKSSRNWRWALYDDAMRKSLGISNKYLTESLGEIVKGHHPEFSDEEVRTKAFEWYKLYGLTKPLSIH